MLPVSRDTTPSYSWGEDCTAWPFVDREDLSVIEEEIASGSGEQLHRHQQARQFFYILCGEATFVVDGVLHKVSAGAGLEIAPRQAHLIRNDTEDLLRFLVISAPRAHGDRENLDQPNSPS